MSDPVYIPLGNHAPQIIVFSSGIQVVVRDHEGEVRRLYYFRKTQRDQSGTTVYFHNHSPCLPYEYEFCWDVLSNLYLSEGFIQSEYKVDGLDRIIYQYCLLEMEIMIAETVIRTQCLLRSSRFSRSADQSFAMDLVGQTLAPYTSGQTVKVTVLSRKAGSHEEWKEWQAGGAPAVLPLSVNNQKIGLMSMADERLRRCIDAKASMLQKQT